ncbi:MAG TPA: hypothetical protein PLH97_03730 [Verrucomicrobiota bacterium]|nr:hypothetical protein [Verrucomicrobiota bacterium]
MEIPPERRSFTAIRSYLESLALQQQRILCALNVDGESVNLTQPRLDSRPFSQVEGETMSLSEVPLQLVKAALQQVAALRTRVQMAIELVLINSPRQARELWWQLSTGLKEPLLTLSLVPDYPGVAANGTASLNQLRRWQLQQLGCIIQDIETASESEDTTVLSDALETRALPWLDRLHESLVLWRETLGSKVQSACDKA